MAVKERLRASLWRLAVRHERTLRPARRTLGLLAGLLSRTLRALPGTSWHFGPPRHWVFDTRAWATRTAAVAHDVDPPYITNRAAARTGEQTVPHQFEDSRRWPMPATFVLELVDARVWGPAGTVVTADDTVLADQSNAFRITPDELRVLRSPYLRIAGHLDGVIASITGQYADSYYHWMFDLLPRLNVLRRSGVVFDRLIAPTTTRFQRDTLTAAGVPESALVAPARRGALRIDRLVFPSLPGTPGQSPPGACEFLRSLFSGELSRRNPGRRLYLSRADTDRRKLVNEPEVLTALAPYGFEVHTLTGLGVAEQARLFADAEVVVAPHGGALTNLVFCPPGTRVVELFPPGYAPVCFWTIADTCGLDHRPVFGHMDDPANAASQWAPYRTEPGRVIAALRDLGVNARTA